MAKVLREYPRFSACGLNCGLCPRFHTEGASKCPGCGGEDFFSKRPSCGVISCNQRHGVSYCFRCAEYPCDKIEDATCVDSFITHRHMRRDSDRARAEGIDAYRADLDEKVALLEALLRDYNDGRRKSLFCTAVNLLPLADVRAVAAQRQQEGYQIYP